MSYALVVLCENFSRPLKKLKIRFRPLVLKCTKNGALVVIRDYNPSFLAFSQCKIKLILMTLTWLKRKLTN